MLKANGQVEQAHQTLMCMIGKLSKDWKADWLKHLPQLVHTYNSMRFGHHQIQPTLFGVWALITVHTHCNFYFPTIRGMKNHQCVDHYATELCEHDCGKPLKGLKCSPHQRWRDRSGTMIGKLMSFHWNQVTWSWLKPMPTGEGGK